METALVTGASGFIGSHLVQGLLARGTAVRCLVRRTSILDRIDDARVEIQYGDLLDLTSVTRAVRGVDVVYHAAGLTHALRPSDLMRVNGEGTEIVARACGAQPNPPRLLVVSSLAAAGPSPPEAARSERDLPAPVSQYGRSKRAGELAVERWADRVPATIVRPGIVIGPRNTELLPIYRSIAQIGIHVIPGFAAMHVTVIHVDDLLEVLEAGRRKGRLIRKSVQQEYDGQGYYFAGDPLQPTYEEFGRMIGRGLSRDRIRVLSLPIFCCRCAAGLNQVVGWLRGRADSFNLDKMREASAGSWCCDLKTTHCDLGCVPHESLLIRVAETAQAYREAGWI